MLKYNVYSISFETGPLTQQAGLTGVIQRKAGNKIMKIELIQMFKRLIDNLERQNWKIFE